MVWDEIIGAEQVAGRQVKLQFEKSVKKSKKEEEKSNRWWVESRNAAIIFLFDAQERNRRRRRRSRRQLWIDSWKRRLRADDGFVVAVDEAVVVVAVDEAVVSSESTLENADFSNVDEFQCLTSQVSMFSKLNFPNIGKLKGQSCYNNNFLDQVPDLSSLLGDIVLSPLVHT